MFNELLGVFLFLLPAAVANMIPPLFKKINILNYPIDGRLKFRGKRVCGANKTLRGFVFGTLAAILVVYLQKVFFITFSSYSLIDYSNVNFLLLGFLLGFGALVGDSIESFFKRQRGISPGKPWVPFDQIDWVVGSFVFSSFYISISFGSMLIGIIGFGILHPIVNFSAYYLGLQKNKL